MYIERLKETHCTTLRRTSSRGQAETGNENQLLNMERVLTDNKIRVVHEIDLKGVSGSMPGNRTDIDDIIKIKKTANDFDYLILPCADRFTRAGSLHGQKMLYDLGAAGITVYFVHENVFSDDDRGRQYLTFLFDAARQTAFQIGKNNAEGTTYSVLAGRSPYTKRPPFALDRLYLVGERRMHIIRNLGDGSQEMWSAEVDPSERKLIQTFDKNAASGQLNHYRKQKNESIVLIPGDPNHVAIVCRILEERWVKGYGDHRIARRFNDEGVPTYEGGETWCTSSIHRIAHSPIYIGQAIRLRRKSGVYVAGTKAGPAELSGRTLKDLASSALLSPYQPSS